MRVKISNYINRLHCDIHTNYMERKYSHDWPVKSNQTKFENFLEGVEECIQFIYDYTINLIWFDRRTQKVDVRIDAWDTWSMDHTLSYIILPMLIQLKETKHGAPNVDNEDVPEELRMPDGWKETRYNIDGETDPNFFKRWDWILDEMIHAFKQKNKDDWQGYYYNYNEWDMDAVKAEQKRISNGFRLFGKYYESLWD